MEEINNLFAKYSVDGVGVDYATPGAGTLNDYSVGKQIGKRKLRNRSWSLCNSETRFSKEK